jgi:hypothetical protein
MKFFLQFKLYHTDTDRLWETDNFGSFHGVHLELLVTCAELRITALNDNDESCRDCRVKSKYDELFTLKILVSES